MHKVLIVEDYPDDAELLQETLERYGQTHGFEFDVTWSMTANALATGSRAYDLVFLDIELPGMDGMDAAALMRTWDSSTPIIFTTSLSQYAARSYEVDAAGFIVKPVTQPKLEMCMDKVAGHLRRAGQDSLVIPTGGGVRVIALGDVYYVELVRHDLLFHLTTDEEPVRLRGTIKQVEDRAQQGGCLLRVSSGCIVNMDYVRLIKGSEVHMANGDVLPLSRSRRKDAIETFSAYMGGTL